MRIRSGIWTVDCRVEHRSDGSLYLDKPDKLFIYPQMLGAMVAAALEAYRAAEREIKNHV